MEDYVGKTCPYCKSEIREGDVVKICPACEIPHHETCWDENKGCTTFGCSQQNYEAQGKNPADLCSGCGATLSEGENFCSKCGTPKGSVMGNTCGKCGEGLQEGQTFCPKCGQKVGLIINNEVKSAINQFNSNLEKSPTKGKKGWKIAASIIGAVIVLVILGLLINRNSGPDFASEFEDIAYESYCEIATDGSWMKIDTNIADVSDQMDYDAADAIQRVNSELGFQDSTYQKMLETSSLDGRQSDENDQVKVSWTYHPDYGLEVMYELKQR